MKSVLVWIGIALLIALLVFTFYHPAGAHSSPSGWEYPSDCCSADGMECDPIPDGSWAALGNGKYQITLKPGDHKNMPNGGKLTTRNVRPSGDNFEHACIGFGGNSLWCLFIKVSS